MKILWKTHFARELQALRVSKPGDLTQLELANLASIHQTTISRAENAGSSYLPSEGVIVRLEDGLLRAGHNRRSVKALSMAWNRATEIRHAMETLGIPGEIGGDRKSLEDLEWRVLTLLSTLMGPSAGFIEEIDVALFHQLRPVAEAMEEYMSTENLDPFPLKERLRTVGRRIEAIRHGTEGGRRDFQPDEEVVFTAYHPKDLVWETWYEFLAYVHLDSAFDEVREDSARRLGERARDYGRGRSATTFIRPETEIVAVPELPGCRFNPPQASIVWLEDWHRFEFRMQASDKHLGYEPGKAVNGKVAFYVGPVLIAETPIWAHLSDEERETPEDAARAQETASPYQSVFVSYSHKDGQVVDALERAYDALGLEYLRDVRALRSGQKWNEALLALIEQADIFQLCWSNNASASRYVKREWKHALAQERAQFIRPMYWEEPKPEIPEELSHIHFTKYLIT